MSLLQQLRQALLRRPPAEIRPAASRPATPTIEQIPPFHLQSAELMRFDPQIRLGLSARNGLLSAAKVKIVASRDEVARFVRLQWDRLWCGHANVFLRAKLYGFLPCEVRFQEIPDGEFAGFLEAVGLRERSPRQCRLLVRGDDVVGFTWKDAAGVESPVLAPRALICTYGAEFDNPYGCSLLERAYPAWFEKWMEGGVKQLLRLRMVKDAYVGDIVWYPPDRPVQMPDGRTVSWREVAREVAENRTSGGALMLPLVYDHAGRKLVDYSPPQETGSAGAMFQWKRDIDLELWKALEVPPEILEANTTGSGYSGRWIPFVVAVSSVQNEFAEIVRCVDRDVLQPLVKLNFGRDARFEIRPAPLLESFGETMPPPQ